MHEENIVSRINITIATYFTSNPDVECVLAKNLIPLFIEKGIFKADQKGGLPIRQVLRELDRTNELHLIPYVLPVRKQVNTNWYFVRSSNAEPATAKQSAIRPSQSPKANVGRANSDEAYIIDLCDVVLKLKSLRQHRFDFLLGDSGKKLPVDAFYPELNLVIEYREPQHSKSVKHFDKPEKLTVSGVHRGEQRKIYDERRRTILPQYGIKLIEIDYTVFNCNSRGKIVRNNEHDLAIIRKLIKA